MLTRSRARNFLYGLSAVLIMSLLVTDNILCAESLDRQTSPVQQSGSQFDQAISPKSSDDMAVDFSAASIDKQNNTEEKLPKILLTNDLLYQILSADIAEQRGFDTYAYETMLGVAKDTKDPRLARRALEIAAKNRQTEEALAAVRLWHSLAPQSEEAEKFLLGFLVLDNRLDEVKSIFSSKIAEALPERRVVLFYQLQQILATAKNKADAFAIMESVLEPYLAMPEAHTSLAVFAILKNDVGRAREEAEKALALKPDSEMAILTLAQTASDTEAAIDILSSFLEKYPQAREVRTSLARLLVGQRQYERAKQEFEVLLRSDSHDLMAIYSLGMIAIRQNDYLVAEKYLTLYSDQVSKQDRAKNREYGQVLFLLSQIAVEQQQYDKALRWLDQIDSDDDDILLAVGVKKAQIFAKKGDIQMARQIIADLKSENPYEKEKLLQMEAQILRENKKAKEALDVLKAGIKEFPNNTNMLYDYALTAENLGQYTVMENTLKKIMQMDPRYQQAYNALGYSLADRNLRLDEARALIEKALQLAPEDPYITDSLGWVLYRQGNLDQAEQILRHAYDLQPDSEIAVHLAEVLWVKGERQKARSLLLDVRKKDPDNELLNTTLHRLKITL